MMCCGDAESQGTVPVCIVSAPEVVVVSVANSLC